MRSISQMNSIFKQQTFQRIDHMFLKSIRLTNFKNHRNTFLSFEAGSGKTRKSTFILGENGTGKSNFLKAVALITAGSSALGELMIDPDSWITRGQKECTIDATLLTKDGKERELKLRIKKGMDLKEILHINFETLDIIDKAINHADRNYFVVGYGASRRLTTHNFGRSGPFYNRRSMNVGNLFNNASLLNPLSSWAMELDYNIKGGTQIVKEALNGFLKGTTFEKIDKKKKQLLFNTPDGLLPLEQLSDGYQIMASWIGDLLYRVWDTFKDYSKPLETRGVLLIDEIDLHLHPKWQRILHDFINQKLPNFQILATTHSPLTAQQACEHELYAFKRVQEGIEMIAFQGSPRDMLVSQLLTSPIFGLETDESLEVEKLKDSYDKLKSKPTPSAAEKKELRKISEQLKDKPFVHRSRDILRPEQLQLLADIQSELKGNTAEPVITAPRNTTPKEATVRKLPQRKVLEKRSTPIAAKKAAAKSKSASAKRNANKK